MSNANFEVIRKNFRGPWRSQVWRYFEIFSQMGREKCKYRHVMLYYDKNSGSKILFDLLSCELWIKIMKSLMRSQDDTWANFMKPPCAVNLPPT